VSLRVVYTPTAQRELFEAKDFYDLERSGLGVEFLEVVAEALELLLTYPESSPIIRGRVRRKVLRRFPYSLLYRIDGQRLRILAVMNQKQRPSYWWGRIR
jgi:toxin ParE1/3/4